MTINSAESLEKAFESIDEINFEIDEKSIDSKSLEEIEKFIQGYDNGYKHANVLLEKIYKFLSDNNLSGGRKDEFLKRYAEYKNRVCESYNFNKKLLSLSHQVKKTNKKLENSLGLQFGIFSAVLSVLSFVLNNSKLLSYNKIDFKNVLLINLSHILACATMFYFAMWFIKPYKHNKGRVWTLTLIIIAICTLIYLIAKNIIKL